MAIIPTPTRNVATFVLSAQLLLDMLKNKPGERICFSIEGNGLPEDAKILGANYDAVQDAWIVGAESEWFAPVPINQVSPRLAPSILARHYSDETLLDALKEIQSLARANAYTMHDAFASIAIIAEEALKLQ